MTVPYKPDGIPNVTPYFIADGAAQLLAFLRDVFGAVETTRMDGPDGKIAHAEMKLGDSMVMLADAGAEHKAFTAMLHLYVEDSDAAYQRALAAGARSVREPTTEFYGDRMSAVEDQFGNQFYMATHVEDVSDEEIGRRAQALAGANATGAASAP